MTSSGSNAGDFAQPLATLAQQTAVAVTVQPTAASGSARELDYATVTAPVSVSGVTTVVTGNTVTYDGTTKVRVEFSTSGGTTASGGVLVGWTFYLYRDSDEIAKWQDCYGQTTLAVLDTPSAGGHYYQMKASGTSTANVQAGPGGATDLAPMFLRVTAV